MILREGTNLGKCMFSDRPRGPGCSSSQATLYCNKYPEYVGCEQHRELLISKHYELLNPRETPWKDEFNRNAKQSKGEIMKTMKDTIKNILTSVFQEIEGPNEWIDGENEITAENNDQFCNWYLRIWADCEATQERIKEQCEVMIEAVQTRKKALQYMKGREFRKRIEAMIENNPQKQSINLAHGKAGFHKFDSPNLYTDKFYPQIEIPELDEEHEDG